jgi:cell division protein FtsB
MPDLWQIKMAVAEQKDDDMEITLVRGRGIIEVRVPQEESLAGESDDREERYEALLNENEKLKEEISSLNEKLEE